MAETVGDGYTKNGHLSWLNWCRRPVFRYEALGGVSPLCAVDRTSTEPQETTKRKERAENSAETSKSTTLFQNYRGRLLVLPGLQVESLFNAVEKQLSCRPLVK